MGHACRWQIAEPLMRPMTVRSGRQLAEQVNTRRAQRSAQATQGQPTALAQPAPDGQAHPHTTHVQGSCGQQEADGIAQKTGFRRFGTVCQPRPTATGTGRAATTSMSPNSTTDSDTPCSR